MPSPEATDAERRFYERNPIIKYLNHRQPGAFRLIWETYLALQRVRWRGKPLPLSPITPILQARRWNKSRNSEVGQHILYFSFTGWSTGITLDGILGRALQQRGARISYFTCGGIMPVCHIQNASSNVPPMPCGRCRAYADSGLSAFGFDPTMLMEVVTDQERTRLEREIAAISDDQLIRYERDGVPFGYIASVSVRYFFLTDIIDKSEEMVARLRGYLLLEMMAHVAIQRLIERDRPDKIIVFNGLLDVEQVVRAVAVQHGIPYITVERGYLANTFIATHQNVAALYPLDHLWDKYCHQPLKPEQIEQLTTYVNNRRYGQGQLDNLWTNIQENVEQLRAEVGLQSGRPVFSAFTNIFGDTALIDRELAYDGLYDWIDHLITIFTLHPELDLVFRVHPAESRIERYKPRQTVKDYLAQKYPTLPGNIKIIPSESQLSSYRLAEISEMVMVYASTIGLETALMGKPTTIAAKVHYRDKGFTYDVSSPDEMVAWIERWKNGRLPMLNMELAQRYAYLFFFRAMIPLDDILEENTFGQLRLKVSGDDDLAMGHIPAIDAICNAILQGTPFINPYIAE